jgi:hypothetical protein
MIDEKRLVASIGLFGTSAKSKKLATNFKRLAGGLQNIRTFDLDLTTAEQKAINDAISVLTAAAGVYRKAMTIQQKNEKVRKDNIERTLTLVQASRFGKLESTEDKYLFLATELPNTLSNLSEISESYASAIYPLKYCFTEALELIARRLAEKPDQVQQELEAAWQRFQDMRPRLLERHGEQIRKAIALLETGAAQSVNRV